MSSEQTFNATFEDLPNADVDFELSDDNPEGGDLGGQVETEEPVGMLAGENGGDAKGTEQGKDTIVIDPDEQEEDPAGEAGELDEKKPSNLEKRFRKLTSKIHDLEDQLAKARGKPDEKPSKAERPAEEDFDTYEDYLDALAEWNEVDDANEEETQQKPLTIEAEILDAQKSIMRSVDLWDDCPEDFSEVALNDKLAISASMVMAINEMDNPGEVLYKLGQNPDKAREIADLAPQVPDFDGLPAFERNKIIRKLMGQAKALEEFASETETKAKEKAPEKKRSVKSNAPNPITPTGGNNPGSRSLDDMDFGEFDKEMSKQDDGRFW